MADAFAGENFREAVRRATVFPRARAGGDVNITAGDLLVKPGIAHVRKIIDGIVEIKIVVVHSVHKIAQVIHARHREAALDHVGMLEEGVGRVVRAEGSAHRGDGNAGRLAIVPDEGHNFFTQVGIENGLHVAAVKRMRALVVKTVPVDRIHREEFDSSCVDEIPERADHALAFEFTLVAGAGRETQEWRAPMPVDDNSELDTEPVGIPSVIFTFHAWPLARCKERKYASRGRIPAIDLTAYLVKGCL